jgi:DNA-directed RNA polymerase specialized sigma24 family protein
VRNITVYLLGRYTRIVPHPDAERAENGTFFKIYAHLDGRKLAGLPSATDRLNRFRAFVYRIALNEVMDILREELGQRPANDCEEELQGLAVQQHILRERGLRDFPARVDDVRARRLAALAVALQKLSEADHVLLLQYAEGMNYEVLAEVYGCSITTLRVRRCRALNRLRGWMRVLLPDDPEFQNRQEGRDAHES